MRVSFPLRGGRISLVLDSGVLHGLSSRDRLLTDPGFTNPDPEMRTSKDRHAIGSVYEPGYLGQFEPVARAKRCTDSVPALLITRR